MNRESLPELGEYFSCSISVKEPSAALDAGSTLEPSTLVVWEFVMASLTIGEVSRLTGVRPSALRYYETVGVLPAPTRQHGQRRYDDAILARLDVVRLARSAGFSVAEMRALVAGFDDEGVDAARWRELAGRKLNEIDALIARAEQMKDVIEASLHCGCLTLDSCALVLARQESGDDSDEGL